MGSESSASEEAKEQGASGARGAPQGDRTPPRVSQQPAQTSGRRPARHEPKPEERKSFGPGEKPSDQGDGEPSPDSIRARAREQGIEPRSGSHVAGPERTEELAERGPPSGGHTRHGRQKVPGYPERASGPRREVERDEVARRREPPG